MAELREQLAVEQELAARLRRASDTRGLYCEVYEELLRRVPHLPAAAQPYDREASAGLVRLQLELLEPFLSSGTRFLEVGGGNGALSVELTRRVRHVTAIEATPPVLDDAERAIENMTVVVNDSPPYSLPSASVDLAFSCHFLEHLREDDALRHLQEMRRLLDQGGRYIGVTPHRMWGPHDVSRYFADTPLGLHLREYSCNDLLALLRRAGFRRCRVIARLGADDSWLPHVSARALEVTLSLLPLALRRRVLARLSGQRRQPLRLLEQVIVVAAP